MNKITGHRLPGECEFWCVYSHHSCNPRVASYVLHILEQLSCYGAGILFVTTAESIDTNSIRALQDLCCVIIQRDNQGYDFSSYKCGIFELKVISEAHHTGAKNLLLLNDSVFGPITQLKGHISSCKDWEIKGMTDSVDQGFYHIQSYFLVYGSSLVFSEVFLGFWENLDFGNVDDLSILKQRVISDFEIGGSRYFARAGVPLGAEYSIVKLMKAEIESFELQLTNSIPRGEIIRASVINSQANSTHAYWDSLIEMGFPFLKRQLLTENPLGLDLTHWPELVSVRNLDVFTNIFEFLCERKPSMDFIYLTYSARQVKERLKPNGNLSLEICNSFADLVPSVRNLPATALFTFDSEYYLDNNQDVYAASQLDSNSSEFALRHFVSHGFSEQRKFRLIRLDSEHKFVF